MSFAPNVRWSKNEPATIGEAALDPPLGPYFRFSIVIDWIIIAITRGQCSFFPKDELTGEENILFDIESLDTFDHRLCHLGIRGIFALRQPHIGDRGEVKNDRNL